MVHYMYMGIDIGSISTDVVIIDEKEAIRSYCVKRSGYDHKMSAEIAIQECQKNAQEDFRNITNIVSTGYGRKNIKSDKEITEISCHAMGIHKLNPHVRTLIDIGGQDTKIIRIDENGYVIDFVMNDKCAAGTGRFLETMSDILDIPIEAMGDIAVKAKNVQFISSTCTVFAESEVISKIGEGASMEGIIAGIHQSVCERIYGMLTSLGIVHSIAMTGGVAKNNGIVKGMERLVGNSIFVPSEPQIIGAYGAAIYASRLGKEVSRCNN